MGEHYAVFIRHGDYHHQAATPGAFQPYPLTTEGEVQAASSVPKLLAFSQQHGLHIAPVIHSSVVLRAWQTADIIRQQLELEQLVESAALCERSVGSLANMTITEIEQVVQDDSRYDALPAMWKSDSHYQLPYPGAESLMQAGARVAAYINQVMAALPPHTATMQLFVGHGAAFRHAACHQGMLAFDQIATLSMFHAEPIYFTLDQDMRWQHRAGAWKVRSQHTSYTD